MQLIDHPSSIEANPEFIQKYRFSNPHARQYSPRYRSPDLPCSTLRQATSRHTHPGHIQYRIGYRLIYLRPGQEYHPPTFRRWALLAAGVVLSIGMGVLFGRIGVCVGWDVLFRATSIMYKSQSKIVVRKG